MDSILYARTKQLMLALDELAGPGKPVCVALTGPDLALLALLRQPGARVHIEHMAIGKAYTCARMSPTVNPPKTFAPALIIAPFLIVG